ncbi:DUF3987 domain-containing protein [Ruegeria sp. HKCCD4332]|uniref:DUF3987 domain-containing protein n=1 Tax=Ruegeria sp. HKCCD4332 TaxID=2683021 RepID=UPI001490ED29|nr:DUF3987 domain-containing protein [Ruegeria sp. HKCCD4332]NOD76992.1 DUF3987 domain-containing protein [Ruegeria sp. HKCCD4332]
MNPKRFLSLTEDQKFDTLKTIPAKLRNSTCWAVAKIYPDPKHPDHKRPFHPITNKPIDVTDPSTWATFEQCVGQVVDGWKYNVLGPILHEDLNSTVLDLDNKANDPKIAEAHNELVSKYWDKTYVETSQSGTGHHIFFDGSLVQGGRRKDDVGTEIYDRDRFIIMTGVSNGLDLAPDTDETIAQIVAAMPEQTALVDLPSVEDIRSVEAIIEKMLAAGGNTEGQQAWQHGYPANCNRSDVDAQIAELILYHTSDVQKSRIIFERGAHWTPDRIAKKETGRRGQSYVDRTLAFAWSNVHQRQQELEERLKETRAAVEKLNQQQEETPVVVPTDLTVPAEYGALTALYNHCCYNAYLRFPEAALATSLAHIAAVIGGAYVTFNRNDGINVYVSVVAPSGFGKDTAIGPARDVIYEASKRMNATGQELIYGLDDRMSPQFGSKQQFQSRLQKNPSMVLWLHEFGKVIKHALSRGGNRYQSEIMAFQTIAYTESRLGGRIDAHEVRDQDKSVGAVERPCLSIIGEATPTDFEKVDPENFADGTTSRYIYFVPANPDADPIYNDQEVEYYAVEHVEHLFKVAKQIEQTGKPRKVGITPEARIWFNEKRTNTDQWQRQSRDDLLLAACIKRYMQHVVKISTIAAVCRDPENPIVHSRDLEWASEIADASITNVKHMVDTGSIGGNVNDDERIEFLKTKIREWTRKKQHPRTGHHFGRYKDVPHILPFEYLRQKANVGKTKRFPEKRFLLSAIKDLISAGIITVYKPNEKPPVQGSDGDFVLKSKGDVYLIDAELL